MLRKVNKLFFVIVLLVLLSFVPVIAQTTVTHLWEFIASTSTNYTFNSDLILVDDAAGAHPNNRFTNSTFADGTTGWSTVSVPPAGWVEVPGDNALYGTSNFLVMKYEAKCALASTPTVGLKTPTSIYGEYNDSGTGGSACTSANSKVVTSIPSGYAIASINQTESTARCLSVALGTTTSHLLSNDEWMTLARNIEVQDANWSLNDVGQGYLYAGHNDSAPLAALEASSTDTGNYRCAYTDGSNPTVDNPSGSCPTNTASATSATAGLQRRTHTLSNNSTIWDMAGNISEWTSTNLVCVGTNCTSAEMPFGATPASEWLEFATGATGWAGDVLATYGAYSWDDLGPSNHTFNSNYGIGRLYSDSNAAFPSGVTHSFLRGGNWSIGAIAGVFNLDLYNAPERPLFIVGLRCASDPVSISQAITTGRNRATVGNVTNAKMYQTINLGDTDTYDIWTYVYDRTAGNIGGTVNATVAELYVNGAAISTAYTDMTSTLGAGWWKLSGTVTGANESREYGLLVKTGKTLDADNFTLVKQGTQSIYTTTAYSNDKVVSWQSFDADEENSAMSAVKYQLCLDDGSACETAGTWLYYNTSTQTWQTATNTTTHTNTKGELTETAMNTLSTSTGKISVKAIFTPDSDYPQLTNIYLGPHDDTKAPGKPKIGLKKTKLYEIGTKTLQSEKKAFKVYFNVNDNDTGVKFIKVSQNKDFKRATWRAYDGDISLNFGHAGDKYLYVRLKDDEGNISDTYKQHIKVQSTVPKLVVTQVGTIVPEFEKYNNYYYTGETLSLIGTCEDGDNLKLYKNTALLAETGVSEANAWKLTNITLGSGTSELALECFNTEENKAQINFTLNIDPTGASFPQGIL